MFYVIDSIDNNGRKSYEILTENELDINGKQQNVNENEIHSFSNIDEVVKYCAKRRSINLGEEISAYSNLYVFLKILQDDVTEAEATLIELVYGKIYLNSLRAKFKNKINRPGDEAKNDLFFYNLAKFPKIFARMIGINEELCANLSKAMLREDYQAAFNLLSEDNVKSSDVASTNDEIDVWKYVSFNENSSYNSITSYEYIDQDIYKKETFIDQDTYIPTIF